MQLTARPRLARLTALALLVALVLGFGQGVGGPTSAVAAPDIGLPFFGVDLSGSDPGLADKAANANAGFASLRVSWAELQPTAGAPLDTTALGRTDTLVQALRNKGITPVINVGSAPTWAAVNPGGPLLPGMDTAYVTFL